MGYLPGRRGAGPMVPLLHRCPEDTMTTQHGTLAVAIGYWGGVTGFGGMTAAVAPSVYCTVP